MCELMELNSREDFKKEKNLKIEGGLKQSKREGPICNIMKIEGFI